MGFKLEFECIEIGLVLSIASCHFMIFIIVGKSRNYLVTRTLVHYIYNFSTKVNMVYFIVTT